MLTKLLGYSLISTPVIAMLLCIYHQHGIEGLKNTALVIVIYALFGVCVITGIKLTDK